MYVCKTVKHFLALASEIWGVSHFNFAYVIYSIIMKWGMYDKAFLVMVDTVKMTDNFTVFVKKFIVNANLWVRRAYMWWAMNDLAS